MQLQDRQQRQHGNWTAFCTTVKCLSDLEVLQCLRGGVAGHERRQLCTHALLGSLTQPTAHDTEHKADAAFSRRCKRRTAI